MNMGEKQELMRLGVTLQEQRLPEALEAATAVERTNVKRKKSQNHFIFGITTAIVMLGLAWTLMSCSQSGKGSDESYIDESVNIMVFPKTKVYAVNDVSFEMVPVEGGTFDMGATPEQVDPNDDEQPVHQVTLSSYMIGKSEVTQALWEAVMESNPSEFRGANLPVEQVSWEDCQEFIKKLNAITGENFRLPTEAEWEFAARGGNKSLHTQYSGSDNLDEVAWYLENSGQKTHAVGTKAPNELGIHDMSGNVWEWCQDMHDEYSSESVTNPIGQESRPFRVYRGGCWCFSATLCRVAIRGLEFPNHNVNYLGFRLAR